MLVKLATDGGPIGGAQLYVKEINISIYLLTQLHPTQRRKHYHGEPMTCFLIYNRDWYTLQQKQIKTTWKLNINRNQSVNNGTEAKKDKKTKTKTYDRHNGMWATRGGVADLASAAPAAWEPKPKHENGTG